MGERCASLSPASEGIRDSIRRCHISSRAYRAPGNRYRHGVRQARLRLETRELTNMSDLVQLTIDNGIAIITINNPPVNALSPGVPEGIYEAIEKIDRDASVKAAVLIKGGRTFVPGPDIQGLSKHASAQGPHA